MPLSGRAERAAGAQRALHARDVPRALFTRQDVASTARSRRPRSAPERARARPASRGRTTSCRLSRGQLRARPDAAWHLRGPASSTMGGCSGAAIALPPARVAALDQAARGSPSAGAVDSTRDEASDRVRPPSVAHVDAVQPAPTSPSPARLIHARRAWVDRPRVDRDIRVHVRELAMLRGQRSDRQLDGSAPTLRAPHARRIRAGGLEQAERRLRAR